MRLLGACGFGGIVLALVAMACGDGESKATSPGPENDAGLFDATFDATPPPAPIADGGDAPDADSAVDAAPPPPRTITIRTATPSASFSRGGPANATWAVYEDDSGAWRTLAPKGGDGGTEPGRYELTTMRASYSVAFACADDKRSLVSVLSRESTVGELAVLLGDQCGSEDKVTMDLAGTLSNIPTLTSWLEFGYPLGSRGNTFPTSGGSGAYELVNLVAGTWDLAFGLRDDSFGPLTKIAFARGAVLAADTSTLNLDVAAKGATPVAKKLGLSGLANEQTHVTVQYAFNGATNGLEVGPGNDPSGVATADLTYATVPAASQQPNDRYRVVVVTVANDVDARGGTLSVHDATDIAIALPPAVDAPTSTVSGKYVHAKLKTRAGADVYEAIVFTRVTNQSSREWRVSRSASLATGAEVELAPPDLSAVGGFSATWLTPLDLERKVTGAVREKPTKVADGQLERFASKSIVVAAP